MARVKTTKADATNMVLCWKPGTDDVRLIPLGRSIPKGYFTGLAAYTKFRTMGYEDRKQMVFIEAIHLIIRDRCNPDAVHQALLGLDEYQDGCSDDMPGLLDSIQRDQSTPTPRCAKSGIFLSSRLSDLEL